jgi:hypothetical protein
MLSKAMGDGTATPGFARRRQRGISKRDVYTAVEARRGQEG